MVFFVIDRYYHDHGCMHSSVLLSFHVGPMNTFDALIFTWFLSSGLATIVGYARGRTIEAMNLGIFLGPIGLLLAMVLIPHHSPHVEEDVRILKFSDANRQRPAVHTSERQMRRAA